MTFAHVSLGLLFVSSVITLRYTLLSRKPYVCK